MLLLLLSLYFIGGCGNRKNCSIFSGLVNVQQSRSQVSSSVSRLNFSPWCCMTIPFIYSVNFMSLLSTIYFLVNETKFVRRASTFVGLGMFQVCCFSMQPFASCSLRPKRKYSSTQYKVAVGWLQQPDRPARQMQNAFSTCAVCCDKTIHTQCILPFFMEGSTFALKIHSLADLT